MVEPPARLWLVFFLPGSNWWCRFLRKGYGHVTAMSWFAAEKKWVCVDPLSKGTVIELWDPEDVPRRLGQLAHDATLVLRMRSRHDLKRSPVDFWCVGAVKGILGLRCRALFPYGLSKHLLANGAEIVERPDGKHLQTARAAEGRPGSQAAA